MMVIKRFLALLGFFLLSCGGNASAPLLPGAVGVQPVQRDVIQGGKMAVENTRLAASSGKLSCPFFECNEALALISVVTAQGLERCTGFLISPNEVMTNDHCVKGSLSVQGWESRGTDLPCQNFVYVHFANQKRSGEGETFGCSSIEIRSRNTGIASVDYAILKLDRPVQGRMPAPISSRGFRDHEAASIYRVQVTNDPVKSIFGGIQVKLQCEASLSTYLYPRLNSPEAPLMTFGDCPVQAGNSGSPIFNENGEVGALLQGYLTVGADRDRRVSDELNQNLIDGNYGVVAVGTQTHCIESLSNASACTAVPELVGSFPKDFIAEEGSLHPVVFPFLQNNHRWNLINLPQAAFEEKYISLPGCTNASDLETHSITFRKGINHLMQSEWRLMPDFSQNDLRLFRAQSGNLLEFSSHAHEIGTYDLPRCSL